MKTGVLNTILTTDIKNLKDETFLVDLIRQWGVHNDPVIDFGQVNHPYRSDFGVLQQPEQLAPALIFLSDKKINSYCEVGIFSGSNLVFVSAYLLRFNPKLKPTGVDTGRHLDQRVFNDLPFKVEFILGTSDKVKGRRFDLVFIDADHTYKWVEKDYNNVGKYAKICMMHDIQDEYVVKERDNAGSKKFWEEMKTTKEKVEFLAHPDGLKVLGIGVLL